VYPGRFALTEDFELIMRDLLSGENAKLRYYQLLFRNC